MTSITPTHDQATKYLPRYSNGINMAKETQSLDTLDDNIIQVQTNLCCQITDRAQGGWRGEEHDKQSISNTKKCKKANDLQMHMYANPCYKYSHHNVYHKIKILSVTTACSCRKPE